MPSTPRDKQMKRWAARREMAYRLHTDSGHSYNDIAKKLRVTPQRVGQMIAKERERRATK